MDLLNQAALLNTQAIAYLESEQAEVAHRHFRAAIRAISTAASFDFARTDVNLPALPLYRAMVLPAVPSQPKSSALNIVYEISIENDGKPLHIQTLTLYSAVLIFNCSVCLQRSGSEPALAKAYQLYLQSMSLLQPCVETMEYCKDIQVLILRNEAKFFYSINDYSSVRCILDKLFLVSLRDKITREKSSELIASEA